VKDGDNKNWGGGLPLKGTYNRAYGDIQERECKRKKNGAADTMNRSLGCRPAASGGKKSREKQKKRVTTGAGEIKSRKTHLEVDTALKDQRATDYYVTPKKISTFGTSRGRNKSHSPRGPR